jgi:acetyl-CoA acyltransferase
LATSLGGRIPVNPSGGLVARGHPIGATGLGQIHEAVVQLRGQAGPRQIDGAHLALTQNAGGYVELDNAAIAIHILGSTESRPRPRHGPALASE